MIPIVEDYLNELIQDKIKYLKNDPGYINKILGTSQTRIDKLAKFIGANPIKIVKGYPRTPAELPCICILLSSESESQDGLGNYGDVEDVDTQEVTLDLEVISVKGGRLEIPYVEIPNKPVVEIFQVVNKQTGIVMDEHEYEIYNYELGLVGIYSGDVNDGDTLSITFIYKATSTDHIRVLYEANYRLEVWSLNGDLVVELYHILKWILLSGRDHLVDDRDLFNQKLGGADFQPVPNYFPEFVYRRALTFWCQFNASTPTDEIPYVSDVTVNETRFSTSGGDTNDS